MSLYESLRVEPLGPTHDRASFRCGVPELDLYLQRQARQDVDRHLATVFVFSPDGVRVDAFYTLSNRSILSEHLPSELAAKLPRYQIPATLLGRMAVDEAHRGRGLGTYVLLHALRRALNASKAVASWAVVVDAKRGAREFYLRNGFIAFPSQPERLFITMKAIGTWLG